MRRKIRKRKKMGKKRNKDLYPDNQYNMMLIKKTINHDSFRLPC